MNPHLLVTVIKNGEILIDKKYFPLNCEIKVGRDKNSHLRLDLSMVSRCHATIARLTRKDTEVPNYSIIDGCIHRNGKSRKSANGIKINGIKVDAAELKTGDRITFVDGEMSGVIEFAEAVYLIDEPVVSDTDTFS